MRKLLFNPFEKFSEVKLFAFGLVAAIACSYIGYLLNARFDGILDMHITKNVALCLPFTDNIINIIILSALLFIAGFLTNKKTRIIDIINTVLIARVLYCFVPLLNPEYITPGIDAKLLNIDPANPQSLNLTVLEMGGLLIIGLIMIGVLVWYITLLWNGFKTATNAKSVKHTILFIIAIIVAEILSSYLIYLFN